MIKVIKKPISIKQLQTEARQVFGDMVKAVVDVNQKIMAINGELHADEEKLLLEQGSNQQDLWGINLYVDLFGELDWLEFDSMINLRPSHGNHTRGVDDVAIQKKIREVVSSLVVSKK